MTNPAIEAVRRTLIDRCGKVGGATYSDETLAVVIAAVLDNLPRAEMIEAACSSFPEFWNGLTEADKDHYRGNMKKTLDAAIAAARATLLAG